MKILIVFLLCILSQVLSRQWVDPHDMNTNAKKYLKRSSSTGGLTNRREDCNVNIEENNSLIYLKRVINLLLNSANIKKGDSLEYRGHIHFSINHDDLNFLKRFTTVQDEKIEDLRKLDGILSKSLERSYLDIISSTFSSAEEQIYQLISSPNCLPLLALSFCFPYIAYNLFKSNFSVWLAFRYFVLMVVMIDFVQRYQQLSQDAEEHNMNLKYSLKCDTTKMTWTEYFKFLTSHEDCEKKVVSLLEVGLSQVKSVIIIPLSAVGTGMGNFASELWENLPFPWNIIIFPAMLIFCAILTAIFMTTINNTPFKFNIMHLLHLEFGDKKQTITGKTLEKLLDAVNHRPMLQEVQSASNKTSPRRKVKSAKDASPNKNNVAKPVKNVKQIEANQLSNQEKPQDFAEQKQSKTVCEQDIAGNSD
ncbi:uncharacterized protein LOC108905330 [Anoplophora glabripennis]|uniref:uncharacterized protein LOC108905330 n=1 Tax=Anoplophora glabripennis TaxID=217634 RepID=UPI000873BBCB|nr:uncharacterized protein LOC108905330 [Anoplophora glabripennis]XP_018563669.1 uncharacterized protein LOC108905330 [Anoplophora glabripennis]